MYSHCIHCSAALGRNEAIAGFPVGRQIAFDGARGRLWAVCHRCGRWNLAPIEERWEPVEEAERLFRGGRDRSQHQNIGLCRLRDGTRLVRIGEALPGELAVWRYGRQLLSQRRRHLLASGAVAAAGICASLGPHLGLSLAALLTSPVLTFHHLRTEWRRTEPVLTRLTTDDLPGDDPFTIRVAHLHSARLGLGPEGSGLTLRIEDAHLNRAFSHQRRKETGRTLVLPDALARRVLRRGMVYLNGRGATQGAVSVAVDTLSFWGGAAEYVRQRAKDRTPAAVLREDVALEMALHEEEERVALTGELKLLQAAWREAEEIAAIADRLVDPGSM